MTANPRPRPALRKAPDATVHPAAPPLAALGVDLEPAAAREPLRLAPEAGPGPGKGAKKKDKPRPTRDRPPVVTPGGPTVNLVVPVPKAMRKRLRAKAAEHGFTAEEATFHLLRVWLDG